MGLTAHPSNISSGITPNIQSGEEHRKSGMGYQGQVAGHTLGGGRVDAIAALEREGLPLAVTHLSLRAQGLDRDPAGTQSTGPRGNDQVQRYRIGYTRAESGTLSRNFPVPLGPSRNSEKVSIVSAEKRSTMYGITFGAMTDVHAGSTSGCNLLSAVCISPTPSSGTSTYGGPYPNPRARPRTETVGGNTEAGG